MIRPCFDYASVVYGPMLTQAQSESLERQQRKILKIIVGREESYDRALKFTGLKVFVSRAPNALRLQTLC